MQQGFAALSDPRRLCIVEMLARGGMNSGEIARRLPISAPAVSQHLKTLRDAKLVRAQVRAQQRYYELEPEGWIEISNWIAKMTQFWNSRLSVLEAELAKPVPRRRRKQ